MSDRCVICGNLPSQHNGLACSRDRGQILFSASDLADLIASRVVAALRDPAFLRDDDRVIVPVGDTIAEADGSVRIVRYDRSPDAATVTVRLSARCPNCNAPSGRPHRAFCPAYDGGKA